MTLSIGFGGNTNVHFSYIPRSGSARSYFKCVVNLTRNPQAALQRGRPGFALPTVMSAGPDGALFSLLLPEHTRLLERMCNVSLRHWLALLMTNGAAHLFMRSFAIYRFFGEVSNQIILPT